MLREACRPPETPGQRPHAYEYIAKHLIKLHGVRVAWYGYLEFIPALHLEAATKAQRPTVVSGYMRDE